jgi:hypothetical protein
MTLQFPQVDEIPPLVKLVSRVSRIFSLCKPLDKFCLPQGYCFKHHHTHVRDATK